jgi:hypothetical protein
VYQVLHSARCRLLSALHDDMEHLASKDREEWKLVEEIKSAELFLKSARIRLKALKERPHE